MMAQGSNLPRPSKTRKARGLRRRGQAGFGLLEAIVALTLFASAGMALFSWINANIARAAQLQERSESAQGQLLVLAWVQALNPALQPSGSTDLAPGVHIRWSSQQTSPRQQAPPPPGGVSSPFDLAMFEVQVTLEQASPPAQKTQTQVLTLQRMGVWREPWMSDVFDDV